MSFSRAQQPEFRMLVKRAWDRHCLADSVNPSDKAAHRAWYEAELLDATGHASTSDCGGGRDYDRAMAHFEALAGTGVKWNLRLHGGDAVRMLHEIRKVGGKEVDEHYLRAVARRMTGSDELPELHALSREVLVNVLGEVKRFVRRAAKRPPEEAKETVPVVSGFHRVRRGVVSPENCPF